MISPGRSLSARGIHALTVVLLAALMAFGQAACGSSATPTSPSPTPAASNTEVLSLEVECSGGALIIGERRPCLAVARLRSGGTPLVSPLAVWSSTVPEVVAVDAIGTVTGRAAGQTVVTAAYQGRVGQATVAVSAEDALRITGAIDQGEFRPGATVTLFLQGYYSVTSAEVGRLSLRISDEAGVVTRTTPLTVPKGGDSFLLSTTFVVPQASIQVCRAAVLEVAGVTISAPDPVAPLACVAIRR